jgi:parvulin-like peptidyl-prolyl isomerase
MPEVLQIGNHTITADELIPLLASYQMLPRLLAEFVIDRAISSIECTHEEIASNYQQFCQKNQLAKETERQAWLDLHGMCLAQLEALATRWLKIEKFKRTKWGNKLKFYFLNRKSQLDKVVYSLIQTQDASIAQELYFRIQEGEESFTELARKYSQGPEALTGGFQGPVELGSCHPKMAKMLSASQPGQLWSPIRLGKSLAIVRLEKLIPAQLNEPMRQRLLAELFTTWMQEQLNQLFSFDR